MADMNESDIERTRQLLAALLKPPEAKPAGKSFANIESSLTWTGTKITLPAEPYHMTPKEGIEALTRFEKAEQQVIAIHEIIDAHPWDGAVAFMKAMKEIFGWASPIPKPGFFGPTPPTMVSIETGPNETATIFWGQFQVPGIDGALETGFDQKDGRPVFVINGQTRRKCLEVVHTLAELTRKIVREQSIYRGRALRLTVNREGGLNMDTPPKFMNLSKVNEAELVFSESLLDQVQTNLWTVIEHTARCRKEGVPLKRGVLLEGPYGTGKTLCATVTAKKCEANGWTFVTVPRVTALESALQFAQNYQPCAVFVEDVDREMAGARTAKMDDILNTVDGIISKGAEIMVVLTSNEAKNINRAMMRPGRLDAILHIDAPDAKAVESLIRIYGRDLIKPDADLTEAGEALKGRIPAVVRECVERSKLYAIGRVGEGAEFTITGADIARAARGMAHHLKLLDGEKPTEQTPAEQLAQAFQTVLKAGVNDTTDAGVAKDAKTIMAHIEKMAPAIGVKLS